ncbi:unnamed protein product [Mytilus edulis]|uniref:Tc1-like transposase DDE domain-containing protein n=1 Tax=Mytilus edulis TaxID=6550 RepID=A0A8S3Q8X4_MYTED|nr:unnamed protein product [Mytilus edulis]
MAERKRILSSHSKEIVYNVSKFFESMIQPTSTPVKAHTERAAEATLVSEATIRRIRREKNEKGRLFSPERQKVRGPYKPVDDFDKCAIRQKIHEFYTVRRQLPTIDRLYESLKCDIYFPGGKSLLLKIVKELGFKWKRSQTKRKVLIEKDAIVEKRIQYLNRIKDYRKKGMNLVYIDETWIDTAYTAKKCWQHEDECGLNLRLHEIQFDNKLLRPQLLALAKANNQTPKYVIDNIARERGHDILRLPPYHPDLNPIELIWNQVKQSVASRNVTHRIDDVLKLAHEAVADITVSDWEKTCRHVAIIEEEYRKRDIVIDEQMERLIIDLADSSDSDSDNDDNV